jgi:uncharacterized protein YraI
MLYDVEMVILATLQCTPAQAHAEYAAIEALLINLQHTFPLTFGKVTASTLNVRDKPGTSAAVLGALAMGADVEVWGRTKANDWLAVRTLDHQVCGWVAQQYVREAA